MSAETSTALRVAEGELAAALVVERVGLVEHEQARLLAAADLLQHVLDRAGHRRQLLLVGALASTTCSSRSARLVSSSVAPKASTSWWGSLRMKPTVSVTR